MLVYCDSCIPIYYYDHTGPLNVPTTNRLRIAGGLAATGSKEVLSMTAIVWLLAFSSLPAPAASFLNERHAYVRGEKAVLRLQVGADSDEVAFNVSGWLAQRVKAEEGEAPCTIDTSLLRAGDYTVRAQPFGAGKPVGDPVAFSLAIAPERNAQRFPVWNWNTVSTAGMRQLLDRGINGARLGSVQAPLSPGSGGDARILDEATRLGMDLNLYPYPLLSRHWANEEAALCLLPNGQRSRVPSEMYAAPRPAWTCSAWMTTPW